MLDPEVRTGVGLAAMRIMRTPHVRIAFLAVAAAACTPETTSFRSTDRIDSSNPDVPAPAIYDLRDVARVRVWSTGGFIGSSEDPMTQIGIQVDNVSRGPIVFDGDSAALAIFDEQGVALAEPVLTSIVPLGPSQVTIAPGASAKLDLYFKLAVRPRRVASMRARWTLIAGGERIVRSTSFVRDDEVVWPATASASRK